MLTTLIYITFTSLIISCASLFVARLITRRTAQTASDNLDAQILRLVVQSLGTSWSPSATIEHRVRELLDEYTPEALNPQQLELLEWLLEISQWPEVEDEPETITADVPLDLDDFEAPASEPVKLVAVQNQELDWEQTKSFLSEYGDDDVFERIDEIHDLSTELQGSEDPDRRANAAIKLGQLGDPTSVPVLIEALRNDGADQVRTYSAVALGMIGSQDAVRPLIEVINSNITQRFEGPKDFNYGGYQLIRSLQREIDPEPEDWLGQDPIAAQIWALGRIGSPGACGVLVERLSDADPGIRWFAAWALGKIGDQRIVNDLTALVDDPVDDVAWIAIWALGRMHSIEAVPDLVNAAANPNPSIRRIAIWALGRSRHLRGREVAMHALTDPERGVRQVAAWALSQIEEPQFVKSA